MRPTGTCYVAVRARTLLSATPEALLRRLEGLARSDEQDASRGATLLGISKNIPFDLAYELRARIGASRPGRAIVGCHTEVLPSSSSPYSLAVADFHPSSPSERIVPFRFSHLGREPIALGREIKPSSTSGNEELDQDEFARFMARSRAVGTTSAWSATEPPEHLRVADVIKDLEGDAPEHVQDLLFCTGGRSERFLAALSGYPAARKMGLVASSTPFHSPAGAPYTLFQGSSTFSSGTVGLAVLRQPAESHLSPSAVTVHASGIESLGDPLQVTSAKGNLILLLNGTNAARHLLQLIQSLFPTSSSFVQASADKETSFYAAVFPPSAAPPTGTDVKVEEATLIARISAGDPSRGAVSVMSEDSIAEGSWIRVLYRRTGAQASASVEQAPDSVNFLALAEAPHGQAQNSSGIEGPGAQNEVTELPCFVAGSENGIALAPRNGQAWTSDLEGLEASWKVQTT